MPMIYFQNILPIEDFTPMNNAQRDLLTKALADVSKGIFIGALLAAATGKLSAYEASLGVLFALLFYLAAHTIAGAPDHD